MAIEHQPPAAARLLQYEDIFPSPRNNDDPNMVAQISTDPTKMSEAEASRDQAGCWFLCSKQTWTLKVSEAAFEVSRYM